MIALKYLEESFAADKLIQSGLYWYLHDAYKVWKKSPEFNFNDLISNKETQEHLQATLEEVFEKHSKHFHMTKENLREQYIAGNRSFLVDLHAIVSAKSAQKNMRDQPGNKKEYAGALLNPTYLINKSLEKTPFSMTLGGIKLLERQIYAVGVFYAVDIAYRALEENKGLFLAKTLSDIYRFHGGPSYRAMHGRKGGVKTSKKTKKDKDIAFEIFIDSGLLNIKLTSAAADLKPLLRAKGIKVSESTLATDWIPEFRSRFK